MATFRMSAETAKMLRDEINARVRASADACADMQFGGPFTDDRKPFGRRVDMTVMLNHDDPFPSARDMTIIGQVVARR